MVFEMLFDDKIKFLSVSAKKKSDFLFSTDRLVSILKKSFVFGALRVKFSMTVNDLSFILCDNADFLARSLTFLLILLLYYLG